MSSTESITSIAARFTLIEKDLIILALSLLSRSTRTVPDWEVCSLEEEIDAQCLIQRIYCYDIFIQLQALQTLLNASTSLL